MRAPGWVVAEQFRSPTDYAIPTLPAWQVCRDGSGGLAFADTGSKPFIAAENPANVRR